VRNRPPAAFTSPTREPKFGRTTSKELRLNVPGLFNLYLPDRFGHAQRVSSISGRLEAVYALEVSHEVSGFPWWAPMGMQVDAAVPLADVPTAFAKGEPPSELIKQPQVLKYSRNLRKFCVASTGGGSQISCVAVETTCRSWMRVLSQ
jgi:hypothetical protein